MEQIRDGILIIIGIICLVTIVLHIREDYKDKEE